MGLPWEKDVKITPLPEVEKPAYLTELIKDAVSKGAKIINEKRGGKVDRTFVAPTVIYPATPDMKIYREEQFGPVVPIAQYKKLDEIFDYLALSEYGQQASVFGKSPDKIASLIDILVNQVSYMQCSKI